MSAVQNWRPTRAEISLKNLRENCRKLRSLISPSAFFCPMVKANAYGHGVARVAHELETEGCTHLGVALIEEGEQLRAARIETEILTFAPIESRDAARALLAARLTPVIGDFKSLELLQATAQKTPQKTLQVPQDVHFEFDTGMNRYGFEPHDIASLEKVLAQNPHWNVAGLCTHFQSGGDAVNTDSRSQTQLRIFNKIVTRLKRPRTQLHVLNSSAALALFEQTPQPWGFRPGISLYGADPLQNAERELGLKPVLSWVTKVAVLHRIPPGASVSYNATWTAQRPSLIGVLPVGYGDGYARMNSNTAHVLCRGLSAPVAGTVCMDSMMIDLTDVETQTGPIAPGEAIVLLGEQAGSQLTATQMAAWSETISYEVLTRIGERVPRVYNIDT